MVYFSFSCYKHTCEHVQDKLWVIFLLLGLCLSVRLDIGVGEWVRCNEVIQKVCYYPVTGLNDSTMYQFRVCAVNKAGVGRPSKPTEPVLTSDPNEASRTMGKESNYSSV